MSESRQLDWNTLEKRLEREPRPGGHTYIQSPDYPGFLFMKQPGEDDSELLRTFHFFVGLIHGMKIERERLKGGLDKTV